MFNAYLFLLFLWLCLANHAARRTRISKPIFDIKSDHIIKKERDLNREIDLSQGQHQLILPLPKPEQIGQLTDLTYNKSGSSAGRRTPKHSKLYPSGLLPELDEVDHELPQEVKDLAAEGGRLESQGLYLFGLALGQVWQAQA